MSWQVLVGIGVALYFLGMRRGGQRVVQVPQYQPSRPPSARKVMALIVVGSVVLTGLSVGARMAPAKGKQGGNVLAGIFGGAGRFPILDPSPSGRAAKAVRYATAQVGKPYRWGAQGPGAFDCSGLTSAAWRSAGVRIPRTAQGQLSGLPRVRGGLHAGDLIIYRSQGPSGRHVAMALGHGRMVEALGRGYPVRVTRLRQGWLGAVRPGGRG